MLDAWLADDYFAAPPPKTTGRRYYNSDWVLSRYPMLHDLPTADVRATLLAVTAQSIADGVAGLPQPTDEVFVCGGGAHNSALLSALEKRLAPAPIATTEALGLAPDWFEAAAFAWLAHAYLERMPGNLPSVTGARRPRALGALYPA